MDKDNETMDNVSADMPDTTIEGRLANGEGDKILDKIRAEANTTERLKRAVALKALVEAHIMVQHAERPADDKTGLYLYLLEYRADKLISETGE
jgi:hypothetical protein